MAFYRCMSGNDSGFPLPFSFIFASNTSTTARAAISIPYIPNVTKFKMTGGQALYYRVSDSANIEDGGSGGWISINSGVEQSINWNENQYLKLMCYNSKSSAQTTVLLS